MRPLCFERKILSQGEFDGACFIYAVANAFLCLTGKRPTQHKWDKAIDVLSFKKDFLKGGTGTERCFDEEIDMRAVISEMLQQLSKGTKGNFKFEVTFYDTVNNKNELYNLIKFNTVVLFCIDQEHWVVGSSFNQEDGILYITCSSQLLENSLYYEISDNKFGRPYNAFFKNKILNCKGTVFSIKLID
jgi:hypothetical protein